MTWQGTKTDWTPDDGADNDNFNRIEGNVQDNHERLNGHDSTLSRLDNIKWASGRYRGNDANGRFIPVGFTPDIVLLNQGRDGYGDASNTSSATVIFTTVHDTVGCVITSNGFSVSGIGVNGNEWYYQWIAIKL